MRFPALAYLATVLFFCWLVSGFYLPGQGFTSMLLIGDKFAGRAIPQLLEQKPYIESGSDGYDAQFYVQIAMQPDLHNPELDRAVDALPYRARRVLLGWVAWLIGGGDAGRTMHVYSVLNIFCWFGLAVLLLRWFPPDGWGNYLRWLGVVFSYGLFFSVRGALLDGPSLLAIATGIALLESGRRRSAAIVLGAAGLIRETNILAGAAFLPLNSTSLREWLRGLGFGAVIVLPCALWFCYLGYTLGFHAAGGIGNFALPLAGFVAKWQNVLGGLWSGRSDWRDILFMISLTTQTAFFLLVRRSADVWWRLGVSFLGLMMILGPAVWDGHPGAAARTLLPMGLAFNILVPRGRRWLLVLILGNATVLCAFQSFQYPGGASFTLSGPSELREPNGGQSHWEIKFADGWLQPKRSRWEYWRWGREVALIHLTNPVSRPVYSDVCFEIKSRVDCDVSIRRGDEILWCGRVTPRLQRVCLKALRFAPGEESWRFLSIFSAEALKNKKQDDAICLRNLTIELLHAESATGIGK